MTRRSASNPARWAPGALTLALALLTLPAAAAKPPPPSANLAAADALFQEGRAAVTRLDYATACAKFRESLELDPAVGTMFNLADCEEHRGKIGSAWDLFRDVYRKLPPADERSAIARKRAADLEPKVAMLTIKLADGAPEGTTVKWDTVVVKGGDLGTALPVDEGEHKIVVEAPGRAPHTVTLRVSNGDKLEREVAPNAEGETDDAAGARETRRYIGYILGTVGLTTALIGAITGGLTLQKKGVVDANCPNKACNAVGFEAVNQGRSLGAASVATFVLGGLATGGGAALLLSTLGGGGGGGEKKAAAVLVPVLGPGGAGLWIHGRF